MRTRRRFQVRTRFLVLVGFLALLPVVSAYGQAGTGVEATIPFQFTAHGKVFPAGQYNFTPDTAQKTFTIRGPGNVGGLAPFITRLAAGIHTTPADAHVVFDQIGDTYFLSEIWIPGEDGFLLNVTKEKHEHRIVNVPR
jgi:hypothetical protein